MSLFLVLSCLHGISILYKIERSKYQAAKVMSLFIFLVVIFFRFLFCASTIIDQAFICMQRQKCLKYYEMMVQSCELHSIWNHNLWIMKHVRWPCMRFVDGWLKASFLDCRTTITCMFHFFLFIEPSVRPSRLKYETILSHLNSQHGLPEQSLNTLLISEVYRSIFSISKKNETWV